MEGVLPQTVKNIARAFYLVCKGGAVKRNFPEEETFGKETE